MLCATLLRTKPFRIHDVLHMVILSSNGLAAQNALKLYMCINDFNTTVYIIFTFTVPLRVIYTIAMEVNSSNLTTSEAGKQGYSSTTCS